MTNILTDDEKSNIINAHQKNIAYNQYNLQISLLEEKAKNSPDQSVVENLGSQIDEVNNQISTLDKELSSLVLTQIDAIPKS